MNFISFFYKLNFVKSKFLFKKTINGKRFNPKIDSVRRFKNLKFTHQLINLWMKKGSKLSFLKHYNYFLNNFYLVLIGDARGYENAHNYKYVLELLDTKYYYYRFENLLKEPFFELEYIFDLKLKKLSKKLQKKFNKKYDYKIVHIHKNKRIRYLIKLLYSNLQLYKHNKYSERIFMVLITLIFNTKDLEI